MDESTARSRHPDSLGQAFLWALLPTLLLVLNAPDTTYAQVATNITPSALPACPGPCGVGVTIVTPPLLGTTVTTITGGARPGNGTNLFHSFGQFNVGTGDIANFVNDTGLKTNNILSRVTGGNPSQIDGTIQTTGFGSANLFLMNPAGVLFGANAVLDLGAVSGSATGGSFYATTANYLKLADGNRFYAIDSSATMSVLSVASVEAFGFTASNPVAITLEGSNLAVGQGKTLSFIGGKAPFEELLPSGVTVTGGSLTAPGGQIQLASIASAQEKSPTEVSIADLSVTIVNPSVKNQAAVLGPIVLTSTLLDVSGQLEVDADGNPIGGNSGTVFVRGGQLTMMDNSFIFANTVGPVNGAPTAIDIQVSGKVALNNSSIITNTDGTGKGGDVQLTADILEIVNAPFAIFTGTDGGGVGGDVVLNVGTVSLGDVDGMSGLSASSIQSSTQNSTPGSGQGGNVIIQGLPGAEFGAARSVTLSDGSSLLSQTFGSSDGGGVTITAKSLTMDGATTIVNAIAQGTGHGGNIVVGVKEAHLNHGATITTLSVSGDSTAQTVSTVTVQGLQGAGSMADSVELSGPGSGIGSDTQGNVQAGVVEVRAKTISLTDGAVIQSGTVNSSGAGGAVALYADKVDISDESHISSQARLADAGQVTITAKELILDKASIETNTISSGLGGNVLLNVGTVSLSNGAKINSSTSESGRAGDIKANVGSLTLANHSEITNSSTGAATNAGDAGTITITTTGNTFSLTSGSSITSSTTGPGNAGQVIVTTPALSLNDANITTSTSSSGNAGGITANAGTLTLTNAAEIASSSTGTMSNAGDAGSVTIIASGGFTSNGSKVSTSAENAKGGDILINAQSVQLSNGTLISASSNAPFSPGGEGDAGNITIHSGSTFVMENSKVSTEASDASGGQIEITAPEMVRLINSRVSTTVGGLAGESDGGNIKIDPQFVVLQNSQILAQAFAGAGGAITITATSAFIADPASIVDASSTLGINGPVFINSPLQNVGGRLTPLSQKFSSAAALLAQRCAARAADGKFSTFVVAGREGLPVEPGGFLASPSLTAELLGSSLSGRDRPTQFSAVTGLFQEYDARPIQLAMFGNACHQ